MGRTTMRTKIYSDIDGTTPGPKRVETTKSTITTKNNLEGTTTRPPQQQVEPSQLTGEKTKALQNNKIAAEPPRSQPPPSFTQTTAQPFTMAPPLAPQFAIPFQPSQPQPSQQIQQPDFSLFQQQSQFGAPPPPQQPQFPGPLSGFQQFAQPNPAVSPFFPPQPPQAQFPQPPLSQYPAGFPPQIPPLQQFSQVPPAPSPAPSSNLQNQRLPIGPQSANSPQFPFTQLPKNLAGQSGNSQFSSPSPIIPQTVNGSPFGTQQNQQGIPPIGQPSQNSQQPGQQQQPLQQVQILSPPSFQSTSPIPPSAFSQDGGSLSPQAANSSLEALGCAFDFVTNTCKDLFGLSWCGQCHDFGNVFMHDCKCLRPIYENLPRPQAPPPPPPQRSQQTAFVRTLQRGLA